jgi:hypothetical protein
MWYFDSWAVLDGQAFVSNRSADSINAKATVFLSVPDLEPVPIGRISTALRAQRAFFQDGFRNPDTREEFAFDNLEQIREVIRRAYLGGGLAPVPAPIEGPKPSPFRIEQGFEPIKPSQIQDGGTYYDEAIKELGIPWHPDYIFDNLGDLCDRSKRSALLEKVHHSSDKLEPYLRAFAEASLLELLRINASQVHLSDVRDTFVGWAHILRCLGYWDDVRLDVFEKLGLAGIERELIFDWDRMRYVSLSDKGVLFRIPCPLRKTPVERKWSGHIQSLGHKLLLPLVDRKYFEVNNQLPEFIPSLFCAMVIVLTREVFVSRLPPLHMGDRFRLVGRACEWLAQELPRVELPQPVESQLSNFAWRRLDMNRSRFEEENGGQQTAYQ